MTNQPTDPFNYYVRLGRVRDFVLQNIGEPMPLGRAADIAGLERKYFSKFFRERTGLLYSEWLRGQRIKRAKQLLRERNWQISEVAIRVGYRYLTSFERAFKIEAGITPSEFKRSVTPNHPLQTCREDKRRINHD